MISVLTQFMLMETTVVTKVVTRNSMKEVHSVILQPKRKNYKFKNLTKGLGLTKRIIYNGVSYDYLEPIILT